MAGLRDRAITYRLREIAADTGRVCGGCEEMSAAESQAITQYWIDRYQDEVALLRALPVCATDADVHLALTRAS